MMNSLVFPDENLIALGAVIDLLAVVWSQPRRSTGPGDRTSLQNRYLYKIYLIFEVLALKVRTVPYFENQGPNRLQHVM